MRLPATDLKASDPERKRRRRTVPGSNVNNNKGFTCTITNGDCSEAEMHRKEKVAKFSHHKRVADYLLGKSVGEGSFAKVRLGLHVQTAEEVAVKVMSKARAKKDSYVHKNLRREGRILQMARHRNIVQVYDILETDNNYYLVTEYCRGGELIDIVTDKGCLPEHDVRRYMTQLISAVAHLHDRGIVHRDLKVENLLLNDRGEIKIIDFGLSNVISASNADPKRALATQCGSPAYAAPELLAKNLYGPKVDVWSIGIITYALLVGKLPFTVEPFRIPKLCRKMLLGDMNPIPSHLSGNCRHFIRRLLVPDPDIRPSIAQAMKMTWISISPRNAAKSGYGTGESKTADLHTSPDVDTEVVREMTSRMEFEFSDVLNCVRKNRPGEALATYYLLLKQKARQNDVIERRAHDVIGSDGNLDHGHESDSKTSEDEEGLNDVDDVNDDITLNNFLKEELYKEPRNALLPRTNSKCGDVNCRTPYNNHVIVDDIISLHTDEKTITSSGRKDYPEQNPKINGVDKREVPSNTCETSLKNGRYIPVEDTVKQKVDNPENDEENEEDKCKNSESKLPGLPSTPSGKNAKSERKSRGPSSMRDLVKTMSRAREVLQRRSRFGQGKNSSEDKKRNNSPELSRFTRLLSRNSDDSKTNSDSNEHNTGNTLVTSKPEHKSPQVSKKLWKNHLTPGDGVNSARGRFRLPETPPLTTPLPMRQSSCSYRSDRRSPLPTDGYLVNHKTNQATPVTPRISSFRNRLQVDASLQGNSSPESGTKFPRISIDRSRGLENMSSNPLGHNNLTPRYYFPSPPRTPLSRENAMGTTNSGVREIIDRFQSLLDTDAPPKKNAGKDSQIESFSQRSNDPTAAAMAYLASHRRKKEDFRSKTPSVPIQYLSPAVRSSTQSPYVIRRQQSVSQNGNYVMKHHDKNFSSHFGHDLEPKHLGDGIVQSYSPKRQNSQLNEQKTNLNGNKNNSPVVWYKSTV